MEINYGGHYDFGASDVAMKDEEILQARTAAGGRTVMIPATAGSIVLHQEHADGSKSTVTLGPGHYAINEPGTWHTADIRGEATALFITAGWGTEHRPR